MVRSLTNRRKVVSMKQCTDCKVPVDPRNDDTTLNGHGRCRVCQKKLDVPMPYEYVDHAGNLNYGCFFPSTDLNVNEMGGRGTGKPTGVYFR